MLLKISWNSSIDESATYLDLGSTITYEIVPKSVHTCLSVLPIYGMIPGNPFSVSLFNTSCKSPWISSALLNIQSFNLIFFLGNRKKLHRAKLGEYCGSGTTDILFFIICCTMACWRNQSFLHHFSGCFLLISYLIIVINQEASQKSCTMTAVCSHAVSWWRNQSSFFMFPPHILPQPPRTW